MLPRDIFVLCGQSIHNTDCLFDCRQTDSSVGITQLLSFMDKNDTFTQVEGNHFISLVSLQKVLFDVT